MADLDEFFAKKSKKKKGRGGKKEGDGAAKPEKKKEEKDSQLAVGSEDSEWKEEEGQVEVTAEGLKVQALVEYGDDGNPTQTAATAEQPPDTVEEVQLTESKPSKSASPWQHAAQEQPEAESPTTVVSGLPVSAGRYVPPSKRKTKQNPSAPPDIHSTQAFPTLGGVSTTAQSSGASSTRAKEQSYTELQLSNKYSALGVD